MPVTKGIVILLTGGSFHPVSHKKLIFSLTFWDIYSCTWSAAIFYICHHTSSIEINLIFQKISKATSLHQRKSQNPKTSPVPIGTNFYLKYLESWTHKTEQVWFIDEDNEKSQKVSERTIEFCAWTISYKAHGRFDTLARNEWKQVSMSQGMSGDWDRRERSPCWTEKARWKSLKASGGQVENDNEQVWGSGNVAGGRGTEKQNVTTVWFPVPRDVSV